MATPQIPIPPILHYTPLPAPLSQATNHTLPSLIVPVTQPESAPCRKCLHDGQPGERMRLLSYDPWLGDGPYRQHGPIFVHEEPECELVELGKGACVPEQLLKRLLSVRAFDGGNMMVGFDTVEGGRLVERVEEMFKWEGKGKGTVEFVHVHFSGPGCFAVRIDRGR